MNGRGSGTFYRTISDIKNFSGQTINHDMGATAASQFSAESATGYTLTRGGGGNLNWSVFIANLKLRLTIV